MHTDVQLIREKARLLSPQQQESLLDFIEHLLIKQQKEAEVAVEQTDSNSPFLTARPPDQPEEK